VLLCEDARGWANLAQLISDARCAPRGLPHVDLDQLAARAAGLVCLTAGRGGCVARSSDPMRLAGRLAEIFEDRFYVEVSDHQLFDDVAFVRDTLALARTLGAPWVVTGDVRHAAPHDRALHDALVCLKHRTTLEEAGDLLFPNDARHLRGPSAVAHAWRSTPAGVLRTLEVAERCRFSLLQDLRPKLPTFPLPDGVDDADALLEQLSRDGFARRYPAATNRHHAQLRTELDLIRTLGLAGYFLIVHDIVRFARHRDILVQGRGYCLGITSVDPIGLELLFERFLSEGRGEPPDIDLDIAHRDREEVLQYVYERYGREHAAMVCNTITWRGKSTVRDAARVLGFPPAIGDALSAEVGHAVASDASTDTAFSEHAGAADALLAGGLERAGLDTRDARVRALLRIVRGLEGLPRHRGIHVGGFVLTGGKLSEVVPIEPAAMEGRTVIQWDKDDLPPLGLVKIDLLGLGMLTLLSDALRFMHTGRGVSFELHTLPPDDEATYAMIRAADTVGVFQIESRAQMNVLPRTRPERFYDLVVQVALVRPGPIQGEMVHPYLRRRRGEEPIEYLHPMLEPVLRRTLGVPLFQEQGMKLAIVAAGFTPAQADALRRAMGRKRSRSQMARLALELMQGMETRGIPADIAERIVKQLAAFASYGVPESHAASFALLVYASAYLKRHFAPEFFAAILDAQPMGFYGVGTLIADARRHGVEVLRPDVNASSWGSALEPRAAPLDTPVGPDVPGGTAPAAPLSGLASDAPAPEAPALDVSTLDAPARAPRDAPPALRLGLRLVRGLGKHAQDKFEAACAHRPFESVQHFAEATGFDKRTLTHLARAGALDSLADHRRHAVWEVLRVGRRRAGPLDATPLDPRTPPLEAPARSARVRDDYAAFGGSTEAHPISFLAARRTRAGMPTLAALRTHPTGPVRIVGLVVSRQRPMTAKGFVFLALEDETGMANVVIRPDLFERQRRVITSAVTLVIEGELERRHDVVNVIAKKFRRIGGQP
jgi:error-prone DNA polymerase